MSEFSLILVLQKKQENPTIDMAKIQIKSEKLTPFGGIFSIMKQFDSPATKAKKQKKDAESFYFNNFAASL